MIVHRGQAQDGFRCAQPILRLLGGALRMVDERVVEMASERPNNGRGDMKQRHVRQLPLSVLGSLLVGVSAASLGTSASLAASPADPAAACAKLATLTDFPVTPTQITL